MNQMTDYEIMAPVGSRDSLAAALKAGAGSVYFGVEQLNMRSHSANHFTIDDLREIAATCNAAGVKTYLTVNTIIYGEDIETMHQIIDAAKEAKISAVIACDIAVMQYCRQKGVEVHLSTQLNISNIEALKFYAQFADVVVLARELKMEQVADIYRQIEEQHITGPSGELVRIEMFCHGASGQYGTLSQPWCLHADLSQKLHCHRPGDRYGTGDRQQVHHVAQRLEDHPLHR